MSPFSCSRPLQRVKLCLKNGRKAFFTNPHTNNKHTLFHKRSTLCNFPSGVEHLQWISPAFPSLPRFSLYLLPTGFLSFSLCFYSIIILLPFSLISNKCNWSKMSKLCVDTLVPTAGKRYRKLISMRI